MIMVFRVDKVTIWKRLKSRFNLKNVVQTRPTSGLLQWIFPITNVDEVLRSYKIDSTTVDVTAGDTQAFTVPEGKRWTLHIEELGASTGTIRMLMRNDPDTDTIELISMGTAARSNDRKAILEESWKIFVTQGDTVADTAIEVKIHYAEEDAF